MPDKQQEQDMLIGGVLEGLKYVREELSKRGDAVDKNTSRITVLESDVGNIKEKTSDAYQRTKELEDIVNAERITAAVEINTNKGRREGIDWLTGILFSLVGAGIGVIGLYLAMK